MAGIGRTGITAKVEIAFGVPFGDDPGVDDWVDVTAYVRGSQRPIDFRWGRQDWTGQTASSLTVALKNDGRFTPRYTDSPYYPNVRSNTRVRLSAVVTVPAGGLLFADGPSSGTFAMSGPSGYLYDRSDTTFLVREGGFEPGPTAGTLTYTDAAVVRTVYLFDGPITSWETSWEDGVYGVATIEAADVVGRLGLTTPLLPMLYEEILRDLGVGNTGVFYPLNDMGPTLGNIKSGTGGTVAPLQAFAGAGAPDVVFQADTGCADPAVTGVTLGGFFSYIAGSWFAVTSAGCAELFFSTTFTGAEAVLFGDVDDDLGIGIDATGHIGDGTTTGPFVADGQIHQLVYVPGTGWYIDGALTGDVAIDTISSIGFNLVGTVFCFALIDGPPSLERLAEHLRAARTGFAGESTDEHAARLLTYRINTGADLDLCRGRMGVHATDGITLQQALYDTADVEGTVIFATGQGKVRLRNRTRLFTPAPDWVIDGTTRQIAPTTTFRADTQFLVNKVLVTPPSGATQTYENPDSILADGVAQQNLTLLVRSDAAAYAAAKARVQIGTQEQISPTQLDVNLYTLPDPNAVVAVLELQPLDAVRLTGTPTTAPSDVDFMVQGGSMTIGPDSFDVSLFTTVRPAADPY